MNRLLQIVPVDRILNYNEIGQSKRLSRFELYEIGYPGMRLFPQSRGRGYGSGGWGERVLIDWSIEKLQFIS